METFWQDAKYGVRMLVKTPGFTLVAVLTLALGIGANATIFSVVNAILLRPTPVNKPEELAALYTSDFSGPLYGTSSYPDYVDFRDRSDVFSGLVAYQFTPFSMTVGEASERVFGEVVSGNYFSMLGVRLARGRGFLPEEDRTPGTHPVVVISHALWQNRFGGDAALVGRTLVLNGHPFTVVGIAPEGYSGLLRGLRAELWVPMMMQKQALPGSDDLTNRGSRSTFLMGRLKPGATLAQAQAQMDVVAGQLHEAYQQQWTDVRQQARVVTVVPEREARVFPGVRGAVLGFFALLMGVVGLVLLVACANVANLMLARASARRREIAIRLALGAGRFRLMRQLVTESVLLSLLGGGAGLLFAAWGTGLLMAFRPPLPFPIDLPLALDGSVLVFTFSVAVVTGLLFGLAPAWTASRHDPLSALKDEGTSATASLRKGRLRSAFVVAQVTLSLLLLVGAGLFLRSLRNATTIDPGFDPENLLITSVDLQLHGYDDAKGLAFYRDVADRLRALPGVEAVGLADGLPLSLGGMRRGITVGDYTPKPGEDVEVSTAAVGPGYFETLRVPILRGRGIAEQDVAGAPGVVVVNEAFARTYWPGQEPLGKRIQMGIGVGADTPYWEVIGVAKDGKYVTLGEEARPFFYLPLLQRYGSSAEMVVRTKGEPLAQLPAVRGAVQALDKTLPLLEPRTMTQHLGISLFPARVAGWLLGTFGGLALLLATLGIYGVMAYSVTQRTREIGVRIALGAAPADVLRLVVGRGLRLTAVGMALGLAAALGVTQLLTGLLYGISPADPITYVGVVLLLGTVALAACYIPARRATRIDPMVVLRYE